VTSDLDRCKVSQGCELSLDGTGNAKASCMRWTHVDSPIKLAGCFIILMIFRLLLSRADVGHKRDDI